MSTAANAAATQKPQPSAIQSAPNIVQFDPKQVVPTQPLYFQRNDSIGFNILTNSASASVRIDYRFLTPEGEIKEGEINTGVFSLAIFVKVPLYEGWLLSFAARVTQGTLSSTWCFLQALVLRTPTSIITTNPWSLFWQGFINISASNGWPGTNSKEVTDGPGTILSYTAANPGAGVDFQITVPNNRHWMLLGLRAQLNTNATVGNRNPAIYIDDGSNIVWDTVCSTGQGASLNNIYIFGPISGGYNGALNNFILPGPIPIWLKTFWRLYSNTNGLQAGDTWTGIAYQVLEWGAWDT